jgi:hypothetical protein
VEIQSVHEAKIKYTKEVRDSIIEKKMRAKERKLFLEMQHKQRLEFLRKNKAGNASFKTAVKVDIEQVEDTNHREDEKLMCDIPDVNQCSFVALVKNVPKMYSGGFGMKKPKDHENNRDIKEQFTSSDSISTNDLSLDTKSVKSVQLGPRNSNSSIKK